MICVSSALLLLVSGCSHTAVPATLEHDAYERQGIESDKIKIGMSAVFSGDLTRLGDDYLRGAMAYFSHINDNGGVYGRKIELVTRDDQYDPSVCVANTQKLINEDKVFALVNYVGTPTGVKTIPLIDEAQIPLVGIYSGAQAFRDPPSPYIFNIRGSYYSEMEKTVAYMTEEIGISRIAIFFQNDAYGRDGLLGAEIALSKKGMKPAIEEWYTRGTLEVERAVEKIIEADADAVIIIGAYKASAKFVKLCRERGYDPLFHAISSTGAEEILKELGSSSEGMIFSEVVPLHSDTVLSSALEYRNLLDQYSTGSPYGFIGFEGFLNAKVLVEGLKGSGQDLTRKKLISALESLQDYDIGINDRINFSESFA